MKPTVKPSLSIGTRVELHPSTNMWMRGARYGTVRSVKLNGDVVVKLDRWFRCLTFHPENVKVMP